MSDYYTVTQRDQRQRYFTFETAALAAHRHGRPRVIAVDRVLVDGQVELHERDVTTRAIDYLSTVYTEA